MRKEELPKHIKDKIWAEITQKIPYSMICKKWGIASKATISKIKEEYSKAEGIVPEKKPISKREIIRREKISKAAVTIHSFKRAEFIAEGFVNAFEMIAYNAEHLMEVINHSKTEADALKTKQEEILSKFEEFIDIEPEGDKKSTAKLDLIIAIKQSIQKIDDFYNRDMIRIKAVGELRKHLETFLKLKQEIIDIHTIKKMMDAFFNGCSELDDANYRKYRDRVIADAPVTDRLFAAHEQQKPDDNINNNQQKQ